MKFEIWKDIPNYEGLYQVSNLGNVKSLKYKKEKLLKPRIKKHGYYEVTLSLNNKLKHYLVHRLVAEAFIPNPENKLEVNHKDGNKTNNVVNVNDLYGETTNLEWNTIKENRIHAIKNKLYRHYTKEIDQYDLNGDFIKTWDSIKTIHSKTGIHPSNIWRCCTKKYKQAGGFIWKYHLK